ncbi:capsular biosynthesis protein [Ciceribacter sp. L1K23]|uniref:capsular biosynthesis protein n=1 Tax=Ciceribacter sp. L1K23 TaxID=2820276 RepID=UPI001B842DDD|nr:capsular biosynthesis protein [Ciceribacter sp. L1K23]MBR0554125.1 capsular biosynthesis protein [Ciceribacter sp. L1K23]
MRRLSLLLLQGPASPFLKQVAHCVEQRGGVVHKINFCLGDALFWWPRSGDWFRGADGQWADFLKNYIAVHGVTDILMLGDGRPKHAEALDVARQIGIRAYVFEHGYLRPDWLTLEPFGMSSQSLFPAEIEALRALASMPVPQQSHSFRSSFLTYALYDLAFHIPNVLFGWIAHPNYRTHGPVHPLVEYAGWVGKAFTRRRRSGQAAKLEAHYLGASHPSFFLFPLQLPGDYQIRKHAPIGDHYRLVSATMHSFAKNSAPTERLLFKVHPIDNGLSGWRRKILSWAANLGIGDRVDVIDGGNLEKLIAASVGIVTINSTVGLTAVLARKPVISLGASIYDLPGLTWQRSLREFWQEAMPPDSEAVEIFEKALMATIQVRGGFIGKEAIATGASNLVDRLLSNPDWLDPEAQRRRKFFRYERELLQT